MSSWGAFWSAHLQYLSAVVLLSGTMERKKNENLMRKGTLSGRCSQHAISNKLVRNTNTETSTPKTQILRSHSRPTESEILGTGPQINALTSLPGVSMYTQVWEPLSKEKKAQWIIMSCLFNNNLPLTWHKNEWVKQIFSLNMTHWCFLYVPCCCYY